MPTERYARGSVFISLCFSLHTLLTVCVLCVFGGGGRGVITAPLLDHASFPSSQTRACMQEDVPNSVVVCCA